MRWILRISFTPVENYLLIPQKVDTLLPRTCEVLRYMFHMSSKACEAINSHPDHGVKGESQQ